MKWDNKSEKKAANWLMRPLLLLHLVFLILMWRNAVSDLWCHFPCNSITYNWFSFSRLFAADSIGATTQNQENARKSKCSSEGCPRTTLGSSLFIYLINFQFYLFEKHTHKYTRQFLNAHCLAPLDLSSTIHWFAQIGDESSQNDDIDSGGGTVDSHVIRWLFGLTNIPI